MGENKSASAFRLAFPKLDARHCTQMTTRVMAKLQIMITMFPMKTMGASVVGFVMMFVVGCSGAPDGSAPPADARQTEAAAQDAPADSDAGSIGDAGAHHDAANADAGVVIDCPPVSRSCSQTWPMHKTGPNGYACDAHYVLPAAGCNCMENDEATVVRFTCY